MNKMPVADYISFSIPGDDLENILKEFSESSDHKIYLRSVHNLEAGIKYKALVAIEGCSTQGFFIEADVMNHINLCIPVLSSAADIRTAFHLLDIVGRHYPDTEFTLNEDENITDSLDFTLIRLITMRRDNMALLMDQSDYSTVVYGVRMPYVISRQFMRDQYEGESDTSLLVRCEQEFQAVQNACADLIFFSLGKIQLGKGCFDDESFLQRLLDTNLSDDVAEQVEKNIRVISFDPHDVSDDAEEDDDDPADDEDPIFDADEDMDEDDEDLDEDFDPDNDDDDDDFDGIEDEENEGDGEFDFDPDSPDNDNIIRETEGGLNVPIVALANRTGFSPITPNCLLLQSDDVVKLVVTKDFYTLLRSKGDYLHRYDPTAFSLRQMPDDVWQSVFDNIQGQELPFPRTFLMRWNPAISSFKLEDYWGALVNLEDRFYLNWSIFDYKKARKGDRFLMLREGDGQFPGIVFVGEFLSDPYEGEDWAGTDHKRYYVDMECVNCARPDEAPILETEYLERLIPEVNWRKGHSGELLTPGQSNMLAYVWEENLFRRSQEE